MIIWMEKADEKYATNVSEYDQRCNTLKSTVSESNLFSYDSMPHTNDATVSFIGHTTDELNTVGGKTAVDMAKDLASKYSDKSQLKEVFLIACEGSKEKTVEGVFANTKQKAFAQKLADELYALGFHDVSVYSARAPEKAVAIRVVVDDGLTPGKVTAVAYMNPYTEDYEDKKKRGPKTDEYNKKQLITNNNTNHQQSFKENFVPFIPIARAIKILESEYESSDGEEYKKQLQTCITNLQQKNLTSIPEKLVIFINKKADEQALLSSVTPENLASVTPENLVDAKFEMAKTENECKIKTEYWNKRNPIVKLFITIIWGDQAEAFEYKKNAAQVKPLQVIKKYDELKPHIRVSIIEKCLSIVKEKMENPLKEDLPLYTELNLDFSKQKKDLEKSKISELMHDWTFDVSDVFCKLGAAVANGATTVVGAIMSVVSTPAQNQDDIESIKKEINLYVNKKSKEPDKLAVMKALQTYVNGFHDEKGWEKVIQAIDTNPNYAKKTGFNESTVGKMVGRVKRACPVLAFNDACDEYNKRKNQEKVAVPDSPKSVTYESHSMKMR